ncbi:MAG TPA: lysyl oxidase family protein [Solirubrobacterales bacterium]|nr:lysyl oxidase family protein [Solirubrobacterales bacterium]
MRVRLTVLAAVLGALAVAPAASGATTPNPCEGPEAQTLLCPNLRISPAHEIYLQDSGRGWKLLRATSDVRSRGRGPMELRGTRNGWRTMRTVQRIYRAGGGHLDVAGGATLRFTGVGAYFGGFYWKVHQLARFDLRRVGPDGKVGGVVRASPKLNYCLRDLELTRPGPQAPNSRHYPGCNQNPFQDGVTLGTSVGWSDIYPAPYDKQWINVSGLRGCFAYEMTVDPKELLFESNEQDNTSIRTVRLPFRGETGC